MLLCLARVADHFPPVQFALLSFPVVINIQVIGQSEIIELSSRLRLSETRVNGSNEIRSDR